MAPPRESCTFFWISNRVSVATPAFYFLDPSKGYSAMAINRTYCEIAIQELWGYRISLQKINNRWDDFTFWEKLELGFWRLGWIGELFYLRESALNEPFGNIEGFTLLKKIGFLDELVFRNWISGLLIPQRRIRG